MLDEFRHHIEMRSADLVRRGVEPGEAARRANLEFGHVESHREHARAARGLHLFDQVRFSWIDVKLALRMLVKHPLLTFAAVAALAVGIPVGLAPAHLAHAIEAPLPGDNDNRVRAIRYWNPLTRRISSTGYEEFRFWSEQLQSFSAVAAFRTATHNVALENGRAAPAPGAHVSASMFDILGVRPAIGRTLNSADGQPGAPAVVVIADDLWKSRFGSDPGMVGRDIRIGDVLHTVVGVMPEGFRFPANEQLWLPLPQEPVAAIGSGSSVRILGRLADGVSTEQAQAELSATGGPPSLNLTDSRLRLQAEVVPFGFLYLGLPRNGLASEPGYYVIQLLALSLLLVACGNVAMLLFARTATRFRELAVRTALGASRTRIVSQIFVEALVLSILAAGVGVFSIDWLLGHVNIAAIAGESALPYWLSLGVTGETIVRALVLAALSATVAGVLPARRIIGRAVYQSIRSAEAGRSGVKFGGMTGALIVADIAVSVAAVGFALAIANNATNVQESARLAGIPAEEYLAVEFTMPFSGSPTSVEDERRFAARLATAQRKLVAQLQAEPGVKGVAVADVLPRMEHRSMPVEIESFERGTDDAPQWMRYARVDVDFFRSLGREVIAGRDFTYADVAGGPAPVIVNVPFVERVLAGRDPLGSRVRLEGDTAWHQIVGVVPHLGVNMVNVESGGAIYFPAAPGQINPFQVGIHVGPSPAGMAPRVRDIARSTDPDLVMKTPVVLGDVIQGDLYLTIAMAGGLALLVGVLIVLAVSGIYAMLSLSVSQRTREIGILTALGASRSRVVWVILRRSILQIGGGALIGVPIAAWLLFQLAVGTSSTSALDATITAIGLAAGIVVIVAVAACLAPTRRVVTIDPNVALKAEG